MAKHVRIPLAGVVVAMVAFAAGAQPSNAQAAQTRDYHIESQALPKAVNEWADQAGMQVMWSAQMPSSQREAPEVAGRFSAPVALERVLEGSGLTFAFLDERTVSIRLASAAGQASAAQREGEGKGNHGMKRSAEGTVQPSPSQGEGRGEDSKQSVKGADEAVALQEKSIDEVLVTGTHIRGVNPSSPVVTVTREDIARSGYSNTGDIIRSLPQNFNGGASPQMLGVPGSDNQSLTRGSAPNLRGLGPGSTLTLVNGHRLAQAENTGAPDISFIPLAAVSRVDIISDGASAIYGSDAVAGVVNFVLNRRYQGAQTSLTFSDTTQGGASSWQANQLLGTDWESGSALVNFEHSFQDQLYTDQRDFSSESRMPAMLLPNTERDSFFGTIQQDVSPGIRLWADGFITRRTTDTAQTQNLAFVLTSEVANKAFNVTAGADFDIGTWSASLFGGEAQNQSEVSQFRNGNFSYRADKDGSTSYVEFSANGPLFNAPAGPVRAAFGGGFRRETYDDLVSDSEIFSTPGDRDVGYAFGEVHAPLFSRNGDPFLDLNLSGRYDNYSDVGSQFVPKIGAVAHLTPGLSARASWGRSFRAPPLERLYSAPYSYIYDIPDPDAVDGSSSVLIADGGNSLLGPEEATTWSVGFDYEHERTQLSVSLFDIDYSDRITRIPDYTQAFTEPSFAPFVLLNPTLAQQQALIDASTGGVYDIGFGPYDPSTNYVAIVYSTYQNFAEEHVQGVDVTLRHSLDLGAGALELFANATYFETKQRVTAGSDEFELTGRVFYPANTRARAGATWLAGPWSLTGIANYVGKSRDPSSTSRPTLGPWATLDSQLAYEFGEQGMLSGTRLALSVQNVFDRDPPTLDTTSGFFSGIGYDSTNASPLGRVLSLSIVKSW